jgi:hypothetical protein
VREAAMAGKLFLYLSELKGFAAAGLAAIWGIGPKEQKEISTLGDMVKEIGQHSALDDLVIFAHGVPGGLILEDAAYVLDEAALAKELSKTKTKVQHIRFEGCWVGEAPVDMAAFGRIFSAKDVSGFTWVSWTGEATVTIPKGIKAQDLSKFLQTQNLEKWLMPGSPAVPVLASMARSAAAKKTLPLLWYQATLNRKPPYDGNNFAQGGRHAYRTRSEAAKRTVAAAKAQNNKDPVAPFEYVTVTL